MKLQGKINLTKSKINNKKNKEQIRKKIINEKLGLNDEIEDK